MYSFINYLLAGNVGLTRWDVSTMWIISHEPPLGSAPQWRLSATMSSGSTSATSCRVPCSSLTRGLYLGWDFLYNDVIVFFAWQANENIPMCLVQIKMYLSFKWLIFNWVCFGELQDQVSATQNKEFDPLGPLPHGWGKISKFSIYALFRDGCESLWPVLVLITFWFVNVFRILVKRLKVAYME